MPTVHLLIKGRVQGVFFRAATAEMAERLRVKGWVKNTEEGHVEAIATADEKALKEFVAWCRQGPRRAIVTEIIVSLKEEILFGDFTIIG